MDTMPLEEKVIKRKVKGGDKAQAAARRSRVSKSYIPDDSEYPTPRPSIMQDILNSLFEPGINRGVVVMMHTAFICLIASLMWMAFLTDGENVHVWFLLVISILLYGTVIWFISELTIALNEQQAAIEEEKRQNGGVLPPRSIILFDSDNDNDNGDGEAMDKRMSFESEDDSDYKSEASKDA